MNALARFQNTEAELLAQIDELKAEVAYLRSELGLSVSMVEVERLRRSLPLTPQQAQLLLALYARKGLPLSCHQLEERISRGEDYTSRIVDVIVSQVRARIGAGAIERIWMGEVGGYRLSPSGLEKVRHAMEWEAPQPIESPRHDWASDADQVEQLQRRLDLNQSAARVALILYLCAGEYLTRHEIRELVHSPSDPRSYSWISGLIHTLRRRIGTDGIVSHGPGAGLGYALSPQGQEKLRATLEQDPPAS